MKNITKENVQLKEEGQNPVWILNTPQNETCI